MTEPITLSCFSTKGSVGKTTLTANLSYLSLPISINPYWLIMPIGFVVGMAFFQAKYLKKYL